MRSLHGQPASPPAPIPSCPGALLGSSAWQRCQFIRVLRRPSVLTISDHCHGAGFQVLSINNSRFSKAVWWQGGGKGGGQALARGKPGGFPALCQTPAKLHTLARSRGLLYNSFGMIQIHLLLIFPSLN